MSETDVIDQEPTPDPLQLDPEDIPGMQEAEASLRAAAAEMMADKRPDGPLPRVPEITTGFAILMTLDGEISIVGDLPLSQVRTPSLADIQMMSTYVRDQLIQPSRQPAEKSEPPSAQVARLLAERMKGG